MSRVWIHGATGRLVMCDSEWAQFNNYGKLNHQTLNYLMTSLNKLKIS